MAADSGISVFLDVSEITADKVAQVLRRILQVLEYRTLTLAHNASYSAGTSVDEVQATVSAGGTVTVDYSIRVLLDSTLSDDIKAEITRRVLQVIEPETVKMGYAASFTEGNGTMQVEITVT